jgi:hypothetical protein
LNQRQELRHWAASEVGLDAIPDQDWATLEAGGWVDDALDNHTGMERQDLIDELRTLLFGPPGEQQEEYVAIDSGHYETDRAAAYEEYLAKLAVEDTHVQGFRKRVLKDELLAPAAAEGYLATASGSTRRRLARIGRRLARTYPWDPDAAVRFVVTGEAPTVAALRARTRTRWGRGFSYGGIVLEIAPWVSAETVQKAYLKAQAELRGRKAHRLDGRNLAVLRFVLKRVRAIRPATLNSQREAHTPRSLMFMAMDEFGWTKTGGGTELVGGSLTQLCGEWNQEYPEGHEWHYKSPKTFARDFRKTEMEIAHPLHNPKNKVDPVDG